MDSIMKNWKTSLGGIVLIAIGLMGSLLGIKIQGFSMDPGAAITLGLSLLMAQDANPTPAPSVKTLVAIFFLPIAIFAMLALSSTARAADSLPAKAPASASPAGWLNGYPYGSNGVIVGIYTGLGGGPVVASVPGVAPASLTTTTAEIGAAVGYAWGNKNSQLAYSIEAKIGATNFNGANAGFAVSGPLSLEQTAYVWMPVSLIQNTLSLLNIPNPFNNIAPFPVTPSGLTASNVQAGFGAGARWDDMTVAYQGAGSNKVWQVAPKIEFDLMEQMSNASAVREFTEISFPTKGYTFGAKPTSATQSTKYMAGVGVWF